MLEKKQASNKIKIVLLDAHAIIHRAYHAMPDFTSRSGEPTGALYGVSTMLLRIGTELKPDYMIACYDLPKPTFRHVAYEHYKAGRQKADTNLVTQLSTSREIFEAFSIPIYEHPGFEADDVIGTLSDLLKRDKNNNIIIASGDMDTMQLIEGKQIQVYTLKKGINDTILYDEQAVVDRFGFSPKQIPDYKGLAGDPSDNIPGIKGIGAKTATNILTECASIEGLYKKIKKEKDNFGFTGLTPRIKNLLIEGEDEALFSKDLATIRKDAPVNLIMPEQKWIDTVSQDAVAAVITKFDFKSLRDRVLELKRAYQSSGVNAKEKVVKESIQVKKDRQDKLFTKAEFKELQLLTWLLAADKTNPNLDDILEIAGVAQASEAKAQLYQKLQEIPVLYKLFTELEQPLMQIVERMGRVGTALDAKYLAQIQKVYQENLTRLTSEIHLLAGREFNVSSPKQLGQVIFDDLGLSVKGLKKTASGAKSTNIDTLEKLVAEHAIIPKIITYRELEKTLNTYIVPLPKLTQADGRVHSDFVQTGAATGRFSSLDPNMQNLPVTLEEGKNIRKAFVAPKGKVFLAFDYSQIDLRMAAMLSSDETLMDTFRVGDDVHTRVAMRVFNVAEADVTSTMRRHAKTVNFGILYGMGVSALKEGLGVERKDAQDFYDTYRESFKTLMRYLEQVKVDARNVGYTETLYGRRRPMPLLKSSLPFLRAQGERMAINAPIQGTTADIMRFALLDISNSLQEHDLLGPAEIILQIHDEVVIEVEEKKADEVSTLVKECMENTLALHRDLEVLAVNHVPLKVSVKRGYSLGELT